MWFAPAGPTLFEAFAPIEGLAAALTAGGRADTLAACPSDVRLEPAYQAALRLVRRGHLAWFHSRVPDDVELRGPQRADGFVLGTRIARLARETARRGGWVSLVAETHLVPAARTSLHAVSRIPHLVRA